MNIMCSCSGFPGALPAVSEVMLALAQVTGTSVFLQYCRAVI